MSKNNGGSPLKQILSKTPMSFSTIELHKLKSLESGKHSKLFKLFKPKSRQSCQVNPNSES
jgi:regulator of replication initiation timing